MIRWWDVFGERTEHAKGSCSLAALPPLTKDSPGCSGSPHQHPASPKLGLSWFETEVTCEGPSTAGPRVHALHQLPPGSHPLARTPWGGKWPFSPPCQHAQGGGTDADILVPDSLAAQGTAAFTLGDTGQPPWSGWMNPRLGKACPQERLFFLNAPLRSSGSLPAHSCAHPATSRLEAHLSGWLLWGGSRSKMLERQVLSVREEQPAPWKVQPACRERRDWGTKGKSEQRKRLQRLGQRVETSQGSDGMWTALQAGGASPDDLPEGWFEVISGEL